MANFARLSNGLYAVRGRQRSVIEAVEGKGGSWLLDSGRTREVWKWVVQLDAPRLLGSKQGACYAIISEGCYEPRLDLKSNASIHNL